jgi:tetratricopeptide (TPR) repeat protein
MTKRTGESGNSQASDNAQGPADPNAGRQTKAAVGQMYAAFGALLLSVISLGVSGYSAYLTGQQNSNAQEQELVTLVTDIAQGQQQGSSTTVNVNGISVELTQLGEAEEAENIINSIPSRVSSVERYVVGTGLEDGEDYQPALALIQAAAVEASDPRTAADAWRAAAEINYKLGRTSQAQSDINQAMGSFDKYRDFGFYNNSNIAYTDLFDVYYQLYYRTPADCSKAINEWNGAADLIMHNKNLLSGSNATTAENNAGNALAKVCHIPHVTLEKEIPFQFHPPQPGSKG